VDAARSVAQSVVGAGVNHPAISDAFYRLAGEVGPSGEFASKSDSSMHSPRGEPASWMWDRGPVRRPVLDLQTTGHRASHPIGSLAARAGTSLRCLTWPSDGSTDGRWWRAGGAPTGRE
jgi:hypothetical protein